MQEREKSGGRASQKSQATNARQSVESHVPLAERMRPRTLAEFVGQEHLTGKDGLLRRIIEGGKDAEGRIKVPSLIFWGPPGSGKTTLAYILGTSGNYEFVRLSAVTSGLSEVREVIEFANRSRKMFNRPTILFIDEIHRFNKAQQDAFLPHVERGTIVLIGATTENPSFEVISPLLSRCKVLVLNRLDDAHVVEIVKMALADAERGLGDSGIGIEEDALALLARAADGDARFALNAVELAVDLMIKELKPVKKRVIDTDVIKEVLTRRELLYDKTGEEHYNLISALHKSIRGSDPDAGLYYLNRMLEGGEDPKYIARRLVRAASEDIGLADPFALVLATETFRTVELIGMPECDCALAELVIYLSAAPKSNSAYIAQDLAKKAVMEYGAEPVPMFIRNPVTPLMKELGYGKEYEYPHKTVASSQEPVAREEGQVQGAKGKVQGKGAIDQGLGAREEKEDAGEPRSQILESHASDFQSDDVLGGFVLANYLPEKLKGKRFYFPKDEGAEKKVKELLERRWGKGMRSKGGKNNS